MRDIKEITLEPDFFNPDSILSEVAILEDKVKDSLFSIKSANEWMDEAKCRPIPKKLYRELWYENELCIFFADTNIGKTIKAVQIGIEIAQTQPVLYFDFELSDKQFENRYSDNYTNHYRFPESFLRVEINPNSEIPDNQTFEQYLNYSLEKSIIDTGSKIVIIDNITYLRNETERAKDALPLMKELKALKNKYNLSILCLAHTPKRDLSKPITRNDLQGSKMLINFCDSCFAIGESFKDKRLRYLKQIKARNTEIIYDSDNVMVYEIVKPTNYLHFEFVDFGTEQEHLKIVTEEDKEKRVSTAIEMKKEGKSNVEIAKILGVSEGAVRKWLKKKDS